MRVRTLLAGCPACAQGHVAAHCPCGPPALPATGACLRQVSWFLARRLPTPSREPGLGSWAQHLPGSEALGVGVHGCSDLVPVPSHARPGVGGSWEGCQRHPRVVFLFSDV